MRHFLTLGLVTLLMTATVASADGYGFRTPSGNIYCNGSVEGDEIGCVIVERTLTIVQPQPTPCNGVWGHHFQLGRSGPAQATCGYAPRKSTYTDVANYGATGNLGAITCVSEKTGLTCRNPEGHGFFLSRKSQLLF